MTSIRYTTAAFNLPGATLASFAAGLLLAATPALAAQEGRSGVSVAQPVLASESSDSETSTSARPRPSAAVPANPASAPVVYGPYQPYRAPGSSAPPAVSPDAAKPFDPDAAIVTSESTSHRRPLVGNPDSGPGNPDAGIVTHVPTHAGEINDGTLLSVRLRETLSTLTTQPGSRFTAEVAEPVMQEGQVYIPAGSVLEGRVTWVSGGKRIGGRAAIHLEPQRVTLPDGVTYAIHARVIDTSSWQNTKVDHEGTIIRRDDIKGTLEAGGLAAGGGMAAGALIAGPPGALIGAGIGAGATAIVWFKQDRQAQLPKDLGVIFSLTAPLSLSPARAELPATAANGRQGGE
ncbi:MAG: hypothetical protein M3O02_01215 [Acidobacteriota bacterium]|nr:hypothetical protein [Acidobacteriota bacterium]